MGESCCQIASCLKRSCREQRAFGFRKQRVRGRIIQNGEVTGDIRFQRKLMQQGFAESVNGLDFQAAGVSSAFANRRRASASFKASGCAPSIASMRFASASSGNTAHSPSR